MKTNLKLKSKIRQKIALGLVGGLAALLSGCASNKLIDAELLKHPYVGTAFVSDQVVEHGGAVRGNVRQDIFCFSLNERVSGYVWENYSFKENAINERDLRVLYTHPVNKNFSIGAGYHFFDYPSGTFGDYDSAFVAEATCKGAADLYFDFTQLIPHKNTESGARIYAKASKKIPIIKNKDLEIALTPSLSIAYVSNYFNVSGFSQITPGIDLSIEKGSFYVNFFLNNQNSLNSDIQNFNWSGVGVGYKF